ncbi:hypothetical protein GCM10010399_79180 [Dactylosporangium fulvum]
MMGVARWWLALDEWLSRARRGGPASERLHRATARLRAARPGGAWFSGGFTRAPPGFGRRPGGARFRVASPRRRLVSRRLQPLRIGVAAAPCGRIRRATPWPVLRGRLEHRRCPSSLGGRAGM